MPELPELRYSTLDDDWEVAPNGIFVSPLGEASQEQRLLFSDRFKNGSISADITPLEGVARKAGDVRLEAALVCRYGGGDGFYYAGTGAWGTKFFMARMNPGEFFQLREYAGRVRVSRTCRYGGRSRGRSSSCRSRPSWTSSTTS